MVLSKSINVNEKRHMSWKQLLPLLTQCFEKPGGKVQKKFREITFNKKICQKVHFNGQANVLSHQITLGCRFFFREFMSNFSVLCHNSVTLISQVVQSQNHRTNNYFSNTLTNATREDFELQQINSLVKFFFIVNNKWMYV